MPLTRRSLTRAAVAAVLGLGLVSADATVARADDEIVFGFFGPLTGRFAANGERFRNAIELFVDQTNEAGGIEGRTLTVLKQDDRGEPVQSTAIAQMFVSDPRVVAAIGSFTTGSSIAAGEIFAEARMPQVSPTASHPDYTKISPFQFRMPNTQDIVAVFNAALMSETIGAQRVAILYYQDDWGIFVGEATKAELEAVGIEVPIVEAMLPDARDFRSIITRLRASDVDAIFLASHYGPSAIFMQQLRQAGLTLPVGGADPLYNPEFIALAGDAAEGVITTTYFFPTDPAKQAFVDAYTERFGRGPDQWAAFAWDAISITAEAARTLLRDGQEVTREALRDAIDDLPPFDGATGVTEFFEGTPRKPMTLLVIRDGDFHLLDSES